MQLTEAQIWKKISNYCRYQERSHLEVKTKLISMGVWQVQRDKYICKLIEEGFLNEERFAIQFAGGKFRIKQWGKRKILAALQQNNISSYLINTALGAIDDEAYLSCLEKLALKKWNTLKGSNWDKRGKCYNYLIQKGYEPENIKSAIEKISSNS